MFKLAFVAFAMLSLCACASIGPHQMSANPAIQESFDAAPVEVALVTTSALHRRAFSPPSQRQPEMHVILASSFDRSRRRIARLRARAA
ncbi:hypothetical protein [Candidatus Viadribacter manganicus]|uniref:Uncharacterized protein n=1 Tax=Candidatus Viadribacter manganicus TaxID=1759059 RepID=A0A1B1AKR5_9PROT|nr:hypothetical protein [Candidatus Viadribacter manganicus]ANP47168.1 hypothetical protein ATE48_15220 [Candidatus Viadribacter manganicus]